MHVAIMIVSLGVTVIAVSALSRRYDLSAPIVLVAIGIIASYFPFVPEIRLSADVVLIGLLPPLLYNASLQTSLIDFRANMRSILSLSIGLVAFTTLGVGWVVHTVLPGVDWPAAFAIGAVVAPPDAVAATAVARRIGLPRRIVTILEGESLLNDATALVALKTAIGAATVAVSFGGVGWDFLLTAGGGVLAGLATFLLIGFSRKHVTDPVIDTSISLLTPFIAYVAAEEIHGSGVLSVVIAGLLLGHKAPVIQSASSRISEQLNWRTLSFLLENAVFLLIGLQARWILDDVSRSELSTTTIVWACLATLLAVVILRMVWVFPSRYLLGKTVRGATPPSSARYTTIVGWAGMRGVVTLAAAFAIPPEFPQREVLVLIALVVTAGTLVLQGLSLPWLVRMLKVSSPDPREDALARAELLQQASQAGLARLAEHESAEMAESEIALHELLRARIEQRDFAAWERLGTGEPEAETPSEAYARLRLDMLAAERARVLAVRSEGRIPHEVVEDVLRALDVEESMIERSVSRRETLRDALVGANMSQHRDNCEHLSEAADLPEPTDRRCQDCVEQGTTWVHLRICLGCGRVGCCDSSPERHASAHHSSTGHPVIRSAEPGEAWRWCFVDEQLG